MVEERQTNIATADHHRRMLHVYSVLEGLTVEEAEAVLRNVGEMVKASVRVSEHAPDFQAFVRKFHAMFGDELFGHHGQPKN